MAKDKEPAEIVPHTEEALAQLTREQEASQKANAEAEAQANAEREARNAEGNA